MQSPSKNKHKGLIVAGMHSSGGKTAVTSLLLAALQKRKFTVQPFKVGPDFIDPGFHFHYSATTFYKSGPLDHGSWEHILQAAKEFTENAFGIAEGVMGLFDGSDPSNDSGSTMEVGRSAPLADFASCTMSKFWTFNHCCDSRLCLPKPGGRNILLESYSIR